MSQFNQQYYISRYVNGVLHGDRVYLDEWMEDIRSKSGEDEEASKLMAMLTQLEPLGLAYNQLWWQHWRLRTCWRLMCVALLVVAATFVAHHFDFLQVMLGKFSP